MPQYEYRCSHCGSQFETYQSLSEKPLKKCKECGKHKLERLLFPVNGRVAGSNIGSLAERNYKRDKNMIQEQEHKDGTLERKKHSSEIKKITKMSESEKKRYIEHG
jgi:putative FmdB family regulatory protein